MLETLFKLSKDSWILVVCEEFVPLERWFVIDGVALIIAMGAILL